MKNYFIIHGTFGNNQENWFSWLENELKLKGHQVFNFNYPTPKNHNFQSWSSVLNQAKEYINKESVFICHSSSPMFLIKYCILNNIKIKKLISVSGANNFLVGDPSFDNLNKHMFLDDVSKFIDLCEERVCFYSKNDPYIPFEALQNFAKSIDATEVVYKDAGHFNKAAGFIKFEDLLNYL